MCFFFEGLMFCFFYFDRVLHMCVSFFFGKEGVDFCMLDEVMY